ncbi:MAG: glycosyltransferase [archaeon]|nr:glycosyltransferase [archaeon]
MNPRLSVVVPVFNCRPYIHECIDSVLDQGFDDMELICVFDGVTVSDYGCEGYLEDPRVVFKESEQVGVSECRNIGVSLAKGEYIMFLDGDDIMSDGVFGRVLELMEEDGLDVLTFDADLFHNDTGPIADDDNRYLRDIGIRGTVPGNIMLNTMLNRGMFRCPVWLLCTRRSFYIEAGLHFYKGIIHEDELFTYRCLMEARKVRWVDIRATRHRLRKDSIMGSGLSHHNIDGYVRVFVEMCRYIADKGIPHGESEKAMYRIFTIIIERSLELSDRESRKVSPLDRGSYDLLRENVTPERWSELDDRVKTALEPRRSIPEGHCVSVVMPVYNAEHTLGDALDDILDQSVDDYELICVDDGSTDGSPDILRRYSEEHPNMKVVRQENRFAGAARNRGMTVAKGDYYLFLDGDDRFDHRLIEFALDSAVRNGSDIVIFGADTFDSETLIREKAHWLLKTELAPNESFSPKDVKGDILQMTTGAPWNKMFRKDFVKDMDLRFKEVPRSNDVYFVLSAMTSSKSISIVDRTLVHYRRNNPYSLQGTLSETPLAVYDAYFAVKERLMSQDLYAIYRTTFVNACIRNTVNGLQKLDDPVSTVFLLKEMKRHVLDDLDVFAIPEEDVAYRKDLAVLRSVRDGTVLNYLEENGILGAYLERIRDDAEETERFCSMLWEDNDMESSRFLLSSDSVPPYWKAMVCYYGRCVDVDREAAGRYTDMALDTGDTRPAWMKFEILWNTGGSDGLLGDLAGNNPWRMGRMHLYGRGTAKDLVKASEELEKAYTSGNRNALPLLTDTLWELSTEESFRKLVSFEKEDLSKDRKEHIRSARRVLEYPLTEPDNAESHNPAKTAILLRMFENGNRSCLDELLWCLREDGRDEELFRLKLENLL